MAKKPFFPNDLPGQIIWLLDFILNVPAFAAKYGIIPAQITALEADKEWLNYWFQAGSAVQLFAQNVSAFRNEVAFGVAPDGIPSVSPGLPDLGVEPPAVAPGVFKRAIAIANAIKVHKDYTIADGEAMGLEGAVIIPPDLATVRPALQPVIAADHVDIGWKKNKTEGVEIWVKRGAAAFAFLAVDTTVPKYVDTQPFPVAEEKWTYKAIHIFGGGRVGLWSEEVSVTVKA